MQKPEDNIDWFNETQYQNIGQYLVLYFEQNVWRHYLDRNLLCKNTPDPYETYLKIWKDFPGNGCHFHPMWRCATKRPPGRCQGVGSHLCVISQ